MTNDTLSDFLTRIRNANMVHHEKVEAPYSRLKWGVAQLMKDEGFIRDCHVVEEEGRKKIRLVLKYAAQRKKVISGLQRISKPGRRVYSSVDELRKHRHGLGVTFLSTPKGVMTDKAAFKEKVGGEVLCAVW